MKQRSIYGLDIIRFAAAFAVMTYHLGFKAWFVQDYNVHRWIGKAGAVPAWSKFAAVGWLGVQIFFVISGFVIAASAEGKSPYGFLTGRIRRLAPAAWICATIALVIVVLWGAPLKHVARPWLDVISFYPLGPWLLGQFWTLPVEVAFYAVIFMLLSLDRFRYIGGVAAALTGLSLAYLSVLTFGGVGDGHMRVTRLFLLQHGCYFAIGILLWQASRARLSLFSVITLVAAFVGAGLQIRIACAVEVGRYLTVPLAAPLIAFGVAIGLFWLFVRYNHKLAMLDRRRDVIGMMGLLTYPLYLIHLHVGGTIMALAYRMGTPSLAALALGCVAAVLSSWFLASLIEPAGQRFIAWAAGAIGAGIARRFGEASFPLRPTAPLGLRGEAVVADTSRAG